MGKNSLKKILFVHHSGGLGGAPKSLSYILRDIDRLNYKPFLINIEEGESNKLFNSVGINAQILKNVRPFHGSTVVDMHFKLILRNWIFVLPSIISAYRAIKRVKPDIIHLNSTCLFAFAIASKLYNKKIKVISHVREPLRTNIQGKTIRFFINRFVDGLIAISKFDLESVRPKKNLKKIVIYNFVDELKQKSNQSNGDYIFDKKSNDIVFLYLARFSNSNGWKKLISMANNLVKKNPNFYFVLAGAEKRKDYRSYISKNIYVLDYVKDVHLLFDFSDIFVCPFIEPHFSRGIIEASYSGLPSIGSNIGGVNELIIHGKTGFLYNTDEEFYKYAHKLSNDISLRRELGENANKMSKEIFEYKKNLERTYKFIDEV